MIKLSNGVELSESTVISALKKAGINVEPKHIFRAGDVVNCGCYHKSKRIIIRQSDGKLIAIDEDGTQRDGNDGVNNFSNCNYTYIGRLSDMMS